MHSKGMYLGLQGTRILVGFLRVSAVVQQKACSTRLEQTTSGQARGVQGLVCARQVQNKAGEGLAGLCWQFGSTQVQFLGSARAANSVVVVPTSTDPMGILKSTREFKAPGAGKEHTSAVRGGGFESRVFY